MDRELPSPRRRRALVALVGVSTVAGLPHRWRKPVIDSILMPAHAQTSVVTPPASTPDPVNPASPVSPVEPVEPVEPTNPDPVVVSKNTGVLTGRVTALDDKGEQGPGLFAARVDLTAMDQPGQYTVWTEADGSYYIELPTGRYATTVEVAGYALWSSFPDVVDVARGQTAEQNIRMALSS